METKKIEVYTTKEILQILLQQYVTHIKEGRPDLAKLVRHEFEQWGQIIDTK